MVGTLDSTFQKEEVGVCHPPPRHVGIISSEIPFNEGISLRNFIQRKVFLAPDHMGHIHIASVTHAPQYTSLQLSGRLFTTPTKREDILGEGRMKTSLLLPNQIIPLMSEP